MLRKLRRRVNHAKNGYHSPGSIPKAHPCLKVSTRQLSILQHLQHPIRSDPSRYTLITFNQNRAPDRLPFQCLNLVRERRRSESEAEGRDRLVDSYSSTREVDLELASSLLPKSSSDLYRSQVGSVQVRIANPRRQTDSPGNLCLLQTQGFTFHL